MNEICLFYWVKKLPWERYTVTVKISTDRFLVNILQRKEIVSILKNMTDILFVIEYTFRIHFCYIWKQISSAYSTNYKDFPYKWLQCNIRVSYYYVTLIFLKMFAIVLFFTWFISLNTPQEASADMCQL